MQVPSAPALLGALLCLSASTPARAQGDMISMPLPYAVEILPGPHLQEGLYLRGSLGLGGFLARRSLQPHDPPRSRVSTQALTGTFEVSVGRALLPGFAIAGSLFSSLAPASMTTTKSDSPGSDGSMAMHMFALTLDWFPNLQSGALLGGSLGVAQLHLEGDAPSHGFDARGPALALMAGKDIWAGDSLSVGVLGRFIAVAASERGDHRNDVVSPFLVCTATAVLSVAYRSGK